MANIIADAESWTVIMKVRGVTTFIFASLAFSVCFTAAACAPESSGVPQWKYVVPVESATEIGALSFMDVIKGRDGGFSMAWGGMSVWVFGDTILASPGEDGSSWRSSTWTGTIDDDASDGLDLFADPPDSVGAPYEFLPFTADELAFNTAHRGRNCSAGDDCEARFALWPGPILKLSDGTAIILYTKLIVRPGAFNFTILGTSIATWATAAEPVIRPEVMIGTDDPTLLFTAEDPAMSASAILADGYLYAFAAQEAWMAQPCIVGRVPVALIMDRQSWQFYAGEGVWVDDWRLAKPVIEGSTIMSIHFSQYFNRYVGIHSGIVSSDLVMHVADSPEGPWSTPTTLFVGQAPEDPESWNYSGLGHPEFAEDGGKVEYITYYRPGDWSGEMRLVKVVFE